MTIDYPSSAQIPALRALWKEAFGDSDAYLDTFFATGYDRHRCRCLTRAGQLHSALYWFETFCCGQRFAYVYAVATAEKSRGQGYFSALLQDTVRLLTDEGYHGILLVPENEPLIRLYEKFGFSCCTTVTEGRFRAGDQSVSLRQLDAGEFARLRRAALPEGSVLQEGADLALVAAYHRFFQGEDFLAAVHCPETGDTLFCPEFLGNAAAIPGFLRALNYSQGDFRMPGSDQSFAMLLPLRHDCVRPAYLGFALD